MNCSHNKIKKICVIKKFLAVMKKLYYNEKQVREMVKEQKQCKIPSNLVPKCPVCSGHMEVNLRCDSYFVEDENWYASYDRYKDFLEKNINLLFQVII